MLLMEINVLTFLMKRLALFFLNYSLCKFIFLIKVIFFSGMSFRITRVCIYSTHMIKILSEAPVFIKYILCRVALRNFELPLFNIYKECSLTELSALHVLANEMKRLSCDNSDTISRIKYLLNVVSTALYFHALENPIIQKARSVELFETVDEWILNRFKKGPDAVQRISRYLAGECFHEQNVREIFEATVKGLTHFFMNTYGQSSSTPINLEDYSAIY